jgi:hypothetical protein
VAGSLAHAWGLLYWAFPSREEAETQPDKGCVYHEPRKGCTEEVERRADDERYGRAAGVDPARSEASPNKSQPTA